MKKIKDYIQFAIDNGFNKYNFKIVGNTMIDIFDYKTTYSTNIMPNLYNIIISKEFIEAIAKGIYKGDIDKITTEQAIAIRDGKLEEFINKLIK